MKTAVLVINRNDGYKDLKRGIFHFRSMLETFDEVNYVDWNSPTPSYLWEIIDFIPKTGKIKHFIIPPNIVNQLIPYNDAAKCNEPIARNIPIRRTDADWVVSTNIDVIPPTKAELESLIETLDKNTFYTISRRELPFSIFEKYNIDEWEKCRDEAVKEIRPRIFPARVTDNDRYSLINCCGDFQLAHRDVWNKIKGFEEDMIYTCFVDTNVQKKAVLNGFNLKVLYEPAVFHIEHNQYSINENGEKVITDEAHSQSAQTATNDPLEYVEYFIKSKNNDDWGLNHVEIEYEII